MKKPKIILIAAAILFAAAIIAAIAIKNGGSEPPAAEIPTAEPTATIISQEGSYSIKITAVFDTEPDTDAKYAPEAERVAVVVYEYTNDDISHGLSIGDTHFRAYDKHGSSLEVFPQKNLFEPDEVGAEGTYTASVAFALNDPENYIKIEFYNDPAAEKCDAVYEREW